MSFNSLFGLGSHSPDSSLRPWHPLQDNAASTTVVDSSGGGYNGTLNVNSSALAATGPNSWLASAFHFTGSQYFDMGASSKGFLTGNSAATWAFRFKTTSTAAQRFGEYSGFSPGNTLFSIDLNRGSTLPQTNAILVAGRDSGTPSDLQGYTTGTTLTDGNWHDLVAVVDALNNIVRIQLDGVDKTVTYAVQTFGANWPALQHNLFFGALSNVGSPTGYADGYYCDSSIFSRELTTGEKAEWRAGPEPINTVAPALSGTETEGQILSCTSGTWALDSPFSGGSNGTITYAYQWTRSDDGSGTGEANIGGATSSTYTLQAADVGKYLRCFVRASNDGGYDVAADTPSVFTGAIASGGGGSAIFRRSLQSRIGSRGAA